MNMMNSNKIGGIIQRLKLKFKNDNINSINEGKKFYNYLIKTCTINMIIQDMEKAENEDSNCYKFSYDIPYDFRNFIGDDYSYIKARLAVDLSNKLNVYVNCNINSFVEEDGIYYVKIDVFIRKPSKG